MTEPSDTRLYERMVLILKSKEFWKAVLTGTLTGTAFSVYGFLLFHAGDVALGYVLFVLVPFATGFAVAMVTSPMRMLVANLVITTVVCFAILLATGREGLVCCVLAAPILIVCLFIGAGVARLLRKFWIDRHKNATILKIVALLAMCSTLKGADFIEQPFRNASRLETVTTVRHFAAPRDQVWQHLKEVGSVAGNKPFLLQIGLPVPLSCSLSYEGVGAMRRCQFNTGEILERVDQWAEPACMRLTIVGNSLPGRHWLTFKNASYVLAEDSGQTMVVRKTTIASRLAPEWYWRPLEHLGVQSEHDYLLNAVARRLERTP